MKKLSILTALLVLTGCALNPPIQGNEKVVIYQHGTARLVEVVNAATTHCAKYGKVATMSAQSCPAQCVTQFRCE